MRWGKVPQRLVRGGMGAKNPLRLVNRASLGDRGRGEGGDKDTHLIAIPMATESTHIFQIP